MSGSRILIVEDEAIIAFNLGHKFEQRGLTVIGVATTADEAVELVRSGAPDLVIMDIRLKGRKTGIEAALEIRSFSSVPFAWLTGNELLLSEEQLVATRPCGLWPKPVSAEDIEGMLALVTKVDTA